MESEYEYSTVLFSLTVQEMELWTLDQETLDSPHNKKDRCREWLTGQKSASVCQHGVHKVHPQYIYCKQYVLVYYSPPNYVANNTLHVTLYEYVLVYDRSISLLALNASSLHCFWRKSMFYRFICDDLSWQFPKNSYIFEAKPKLSSSVLSHMCRTLL